MRAFLLAFDIELTEQEETRWQHRLLGTEEVVQAHKLLVEDTVKQVMPPRVIVPKPMTLYEKEKIKLMEKTQRTLWNILFYTNYTLKGTQRCTKLVRVQFRWILLITRWKK